MRRCRFSREAEAPRALRVEEATRSPAGVGLGERLVSVSRPAALDGDPELNQSVVEELEVSGAVGGDLEEQDRVGLGRLILSSRPDAEEPVSLPLKLARRRTALP